MTDTALQLKTAEEKIAELTKENNEIITLINSDSPLTMKVKTLMQMPKVANEFLKLLPDGRNKEQVLRQEVQSLIFDITQSNDLQQCTPQSLIFCLKDTLSRGLRIGSSHKEAWPIKFERKDKNGSYVPEAKVMVGWIAYKNKAYSEHGILLNAGLLSYDEVEKGFIKKYDPSCNLLELDYKLGQETPLKNRENIQYVYVSATYPDKRVVSELYTKEFIIEKSQVKRPKFNKQGKFVGMEMGLGNVWNSTDRATDFGEMAKKSAVVAFCKFMPNKSLAELADFDYRQQGIVMENVTPVQSPEPQSNNANQDVLNRFMPHNGQEQTLKKSQAEASNQEDDTLEEILEPVDVTNNAVILIRVKGETIDTEFSSIQDAAKALKEYMDKETDSTIKQNIVNENEALMHQLQNEEPEIFNTLLAIAQE